MLQGTPRLACSLPSSAIVPGGLSQRFQGTAPFLLVHGVAKRYQLHRGPVDDMAVRWRERDNVNLSVVVVDCVCNVNNHADNCLDGH